MICSVCLENLNEVTQPLKIFDEKGFQLRIADIIHQHFWYELLPTNDVSKVICKNCWCKISDFHHFYLLVKKVHDKHHEHILSFKTEHIEEAEHVEYVQKGEQTADPLSVVEVVMKTTLLQENCIPISNPNGTDENRNINKGKVRSKSGETPPIFEAKPKTATSSTKVTKGTIQRNSKIKTSKKFKPPSQLEKSFTKGKVPNDVSEIELASTETTEKKCSRKVKSESFSKIEAQIKECTSSDNENETVNTETNDRKCKKKRADNCSNKRKKEFPIKSMTDDVVRKHIAFNCALCFFSGNSFLEICQHFDVNHISIKPYVKCCSQKLTSIYAVRAHAFKHENPEEFTCKDCEKIFSARDKLRIHHLAVHASKEELIFACDQCDRRFAQKYSLKRHKATHVLTVIGKYVCKRCTNGKSYATPELLQLHINWKHNKTDNVCHVCAKIIRDDKCFEKHVRSHFEASGPRIKCPRPDCDRWLKDQDTLKSHLKRHGDEGKTFPCNVCDKVLNSQAALKSHKNYHHSSQKFNCEVCRKSFRRALTLKEHMACHQGGERLYKCPFCERTFNSNATMHSHKKNAHPKEWEIWYKTKYCNLQLESNGAIRSVEMGRNDTSTNKAIEKDNC